MSKTGDRLIENQDVEDAISRAAAWEFYRNNDQVMSENTESRDNVILAREVKRLRAELSEAQVIHPEVFLSRQIAKLRKKLALSEGALQEEKAQNRKLREAIDDVWVGPRNAKSGVVRKG